MADAQETITITFGGQVESHIGMEKIGEMGDEGFTRKELLKAKNRFSNKGLKVEMIKLHECAPEDVEVEDARILIIRNGVSALEMGNLIDEVRSLKWDTKAKMRGRVVNKRARYNLCFADFGQKPDYEKGMGRVYDFKKLPVMSSVRDNLSAYLGEKAKGLLAEGNRYYDKTCGISFHGDAERKIVIAIRLGASIPLHYQWFHEGKPIGERVEITLDHGDVYIMSEKATGFDWKKRKVPTLRHAAGAKKYLTIK